MDFADELERFVEIGGQIVKTRMMEFFEHKGMRCLTIVQFKYLEAVNMVEEVTITELADMFNVKKPTATSVVNGLIASKMLVKKQSSEDKRVFYLMLSGKAKDLFKSKKAVFKEMADRIEAALTKKQFKQFKDTYTNLREKHQRGEL